MSEGCISPFCSLLTCISYFCWHHFHVQNGGTFPAVWECMVRHKSCRQHLNTIIATGRRRNGCEVPHMPLFIVLTFHSPSGPLSSLPCGTQSVRWSLGPTEGEPMMKIQIIPRAESLIRYCFPSMKKTLRWQLCKKKKYAQSLSHMGDVSTRENLVLWNYATAG